MRSIAGERAGDGVLHRHRAAQPAVGQLLHRRDDIIQAGRAAARHPARAPAGREVRLREARERDDRRIRIEVAVGLDGAVEAEVAVDLVGEDEQAVLVGEVQQGAPGLGRVDRAGRVVGVDDDERARRRRDEALQVIEIRHPAARRVEPVVLRLGVELGQHGRVQRIGRHRHEHFAARVDDRAERQLDPFRGSRGDEDAIGGDRESVARVFAGDRLARGRDAGRRPVVVVAVAHRPFDRGDQVRRRLETKGDRIADVQVADPRAGGLDFLRFRNDIADGVRKAVDAGGGGYGGVGLGGASLRDLTAIGSAGSA